MNTMRIVLCLLIALLQVSHAQNSTACVTESLVLNQNSEISAAVTAFQTEATSSLQDFVKNCNLFERSCGKDLSTLSSAQNLTASCKALGGQIVDRDVHLKCVGSVNSVPVPGFSVKADNFPACLGASCDPNNLPTEVTDVFTTVTDTATQEIQSALGGSISCQASAGLRIAVDTVCFAVMTMLVSWVLS
jgi:hypothetical protein